MLLIGLRAHGTSEVVAALQSLDAPKLARFEPRAPLEVERRDGFVQLVNDFGPSEGAPRRHSLRTPKFDCVLHECVDGVRSLLLGNLGQASLLLWVHSAAEPIDVDRVALMLEGATFLGACEAIVYFTDCAGVSAAQLDARESEARSLLELADLAGDEAIVLRESAAIDARDDRWRDGVRALREAIDQRARPQEIATGGSMVIEDVFAIGKRVVVGCVVERGQFATGDPVEVVTPQGRRRTRIRALERFRQRFDTVSAGMAIGVELEGLTRDEIARDALLVAPGLGAIPATLTLRAYAWRAPDRAIYAGGTIAVVHRGTTLCNITALDRALDAPRRFTITVENPRMLAVIAGQTVWLRDSESPFALGFIEPSEPR